MQMLFSFIKKNKHFVLVVILAAILRFAAIGSVPPSLNWDEVSHGYNAYSIAKTGKDEWGKVFPIIFRAYGDYKLPVYIYLTSLSEFVFGLTPFAVRFAGVLAGVGTVIFTYLLVLELFKDNSSQLTHQRSLAALASLLVSVEPWSFFVGRGAFEANLALFFFVVAVYLFLKFTGKRKSFLLLSALFFGLTVWTYNSYRVFTPLFLTVLSFIYRKNIRDIYHHSRFIFYGSLFILAFFLLPMFYQLLSPSGLARYSKVSIIDAGAINKILDTRLKINAPALIPRLLSNKATYFAGVFVRNYFSHFSFKFLFLQGGSNYQFSVPGHGIIYLVNAPFILFGLYYLFKLNGKSSGVILSWLLLAPIASSLTREAPHVLRSITFLPVPMILTAIGAVEFLKRSRLILYLATLFIFAGTYFFSYFGVYPKNYSWSWQYGYAQAVEYVKQNYGNYDKIIVSKKYGEPHEFFLFYLKYSPEKYQTDPNLIRFEKSGWYWVDRFDKFYFVNDWQVKDMKLESGGTIDCPPSTVHCLLITSPDNYPEAWKRLKTINFLNGESAFEIYENY